MKPSNLLLLTVFVLFSFPCIAQKKEKQYTTSYSQPKLADIQAALEMLNINIYNVTLPVNPGKKFKLSIYLDEYESSMRLKNHKIIWNDEIGAKTSAGANGKLSIIVNGKSDTIAYASLKIGGNELTTLMRIAPQYNILHRCNLFSPQPLLIGKITPILLYGSGWHDPALPPDAVRFCMENYLPVDFKSDAFKNMPHYYIFSVELSEII